MFAKKILLVVVFLLIVLALGYLYQTVPAPSDVPEVSMQGPQGEDFGTIRLSETNAGVLLRLNLKNLPAESMHAFHIHETGRCESSGKFASAGGHFNPAGRAHGMKHPSGPHAGDMPNLATTKAGTIETQLLNRHVTLAKNPDDGRHSLYDADGSALIIHEAKDDHRSQPSGAAGARIACGVISE